MRTKTLLAAAAMLAAGGVSLMAQVYSVNVVGYVNQQFTGPGFTAIANPLQTSSNTLNGLLLDLAPGAQVLLWNGSGFTTRTKFGAQFVPDDNLAPGTGAFVNVASTITHTWVGEVLQGNLTNNITTGFTFQGSKVPQQFNLNDNVGLTNALTAGSQILKWNGAGYSTSTKFGPTFSPNAQINVAEGFFINAGAGSQPWVRNFSVQ